MSQRCTAFVDEGAKECWQSLGDRKASKVILFLESPERNAACQHLDFSPEHLGYIIVVFIFISLFANDTVDILKEKEMMQPLLLFCYLVSTTSAKMML